MSQSYFGDKSIIAQENKLLRERLEKAGADTRRLDWLEANGVKPWETGKEWVYRVKLMGANLREAIDNAIAAQAKP